jgi:glycerophosphoryl diester phosphodiesterase
MALCLVAPMAAWGWAGCRHSPDEEIFPVPFHVIAHRGASAYAPENTLPAFERALELGARQVELDVQLSRDDVLVLFHDSTLDAKTDLRGRVREHGVRELLGAEIGSWFDREHPDVEERFAGTGLISLGQLFQRFGDRLHYHIEIKAPEEAIAELLLQQIGRFGLKQRVTVSSFRFQQLERVRGLDPEIPICLLIRDGRTLVEQTESVPLLRSLFVSGLQKQWIDRAAGARFDQVGIAARDLTRRIVRYARDRQLELRAWGIKSDADMERAIRAGSNGMTTNWPDRLLERIQAGSGGA